MTFLKMLNKPNIYMLLKDFNENRAKVERVVVADHFSTRGTTDKALQ